jgi:anti-anti-sigma factor
MIWHNLNLRMRILLGYGVILALAAALALFLILRIGALNSEIKQLNVSVVREAGTGAEVAAQVTTSQHDVERYLRDPQTAHYQAAYGALQRLATVVESARTNLVSPSQRERADDLAQRLATYQTTFQSLNELVKAEKPLQARLNSHLTRSLFLLNSAIAGNIRSGNTDTELAIRLVTAQTSLESARLWVARLNPDQADTYGTNATNELNQAEQALSEVLLAPDLPIASNIKNSLDEVRKTITNTNQLVQNLTQVRQQRDELLETQGDPLKQQADAIALEALSGLTSATVDLERQTGQMRQITVGALLLTILAAVVIGLQLAQTIARPVKQLVAATTRINQGDFNTRVEQRDAGEIGQLAASFNQMTTTLRQQRDEVQRQQTAMIQRNQELEQALDEVRSATAAREAMASTVRTLSVPVIAILKQVIVVPLVGEIDEQRAHLLLERLLAGVTEQRAKIAILDVTGVPFVDAELATWLLRAASATQLLGAQCVLVGISPEVAQALVASGADLARMATRADLRSAVEFALRATSSAGSRPALASQQSGNGLRKPNS